MLTIQASIEYLRYLEDCVSKLQEQHDGSHGRAPLPSIREFHPTFRDDDDAMGEVDMEDEAVSPTFTAQPDRNMARHPSMSPAQHAIDARDRQLSYSSVSTDHQRHYSYSAASAGPSPALGPQHGPVPGFYAGSNAGSALTSPALEPQPDMDQEATAALLMLNTDRRGFSSANERRSVSVRDLLTS